VNFLQEGGESLAQAYERFNELIRKCPHHGISRSALVRHFYQGLNAVQINNFDLMSGGNFLDRTPDECWTLIEKTVQNSCRSHQRGGLNHAVKGSGSREMHPKVGGG
jgi:Retrotransposon gag protein